MFKGCTLLEIPPASLSSKIVGSYAYREMFSGCTSLKKIPVMEAEQVYYQACVDMFNGCTALTDATGLNTHFINRNSNNNIITNCCDNMFKNCTSLVTVPPISSEGACQEMFSGCSSLDHIDAAFTTWPTTTNWLSGVSATGVFRCLKTLTVTRDASHVPVGWTVEYIDDIQPDWDESDSSMATYIQNKPDISGDISTAIADALTFHNN